MKIKNVTTVTVVILLVITLLSVWSNIAASRQYLIVDALEEDIHELLFIHGNGELSVKIFKNIESQDSSDDPVKEEKLRLAHKTNADSLIEETEESIQLIDNIEKSFDDFLFVFSFIEGHEDMIFSFAKAKEDYEKFVLSIDEYLYSPSGDVRWIEYHQDVSNDSLDYFLDDFNA